MIGDSGNKRGAARRRCAAALAALVVVILGGCDQSPSAQPAPHLGVMRIVSVNPCLDAILMKVADPAQIAAISQYSHDPRATSIPLPLARRFHAISGTAEEIVALDPDLVVASGRLPPATRAALARLRVRLVELPLPQSIAESAQQVRRIAALAGHRARGEALAQAIETAAGPKPEGDPIPALIWQGGGLVPAARTLPDEMLNRAGYRNLADDYGLKNWGVLPLEYLVARPPRVLLTPIASGRGDRLLGHPALGRLRGRIALRDFPERLLFCGGPSIIAAMQRLIAIRKTL